MLTLRTKGPKPPRYSIQERRKISSLLITPTGFAYQSNNSPGREKSATSTAPLTNKAISHFTDLEVQTGAKRIKMRFFLTNLGEQKVILVGYPWFAAMQPKVNWARAWIDYEQLPVMLRTPDAHKAIFTPAKDRLSRVKTSFRNLAKKLRKIQSEDRMFITKVYVKPQITLIC
jgi:hypothetical protein